MKTKTDSRVIPDLNELIQLRSAVSLTSLRPNRKNATLITGNQRSLFKTKGMNFEEVRPYQQGDDSRQIDWRVTAKHGKPFTKVYVDDTMQQVYILTDLQNQMFFASHGSFKSVVAAQINALLSWLTLEQKGALHHILMSASSVKTFKPIHRAEDLLAFFKQLIKQAPNQNNPQTDLLAQGLRALKKHLKSGAFVFIVSDFANLSDDEMNEIKQLAVKHHFVFMHVFDEMEEKLPAGILNFTDGVSHALLDTRSNRVRKVFAKSFSDNKKKVQALAKVCRGIYLPLQTTDAFVQKTMKQLIQKGIIHGK